MNTFLMWLGGLLIAFFAVLFAGPHFVDWNSYRGVFEEEATRVLGRRVRVGGNVNIRLLPAPYVLVEDLRLADTTGIAGAPLFKIDSFKMWLAVPPLLKGLVEANKIELQRPVLALAADAEGKGNWRTILEAKALPFVPAGVKLDSVLIEDGAITYSIERGGEITRVDKISGELTAQALAGPYSFRGRASIGGVEGRVRIASTEADKTGRFRLTGHVKGDRNSADHKFDGQVRGLWDRVEVDGQLVSRIGIDGASGPSGNRLVAEVRSQVKADGGALALDELIVSFEDFAQPQLISGMLKAEWAKRHQVDVVLSSRWLDIDQLTSGDSEAAGSKQDGAEGSSKVNAIAPLPTARRLISQLLGVFPGRTDVKARLDVEQINLGGETVSGVIVAMERSGGPLELKTLRAVLPGGARLDFSGQVEAIDGATVFDGDLFLGGVSAARVIRWAVGSAEWNSPISDGPFSVAGRMQLGSDRIVLRSAAAEFSGVLVRGGMTWDDGKGRLDLAVEGYEIDTRWFGLGKLEMPALSKLFAAAAPVTKQTPDAGDAQPGRQGLFDWFKSDGREVNLTLRAGSLVDGTTTVRDVEALIRVKNQKLRIRKLKLVTAEGLHVDADGSVEGLGDQPKGSIDYLVSAKDQSAAWKLADLWAGEAATSGDRDRFAAFAPIRVAGQMVLGGRLKTSADFSFDGSVAGGRVEAKLKLDGGVGGWSTAPVDFVLRSDAADTGRLFSSLAGVDTRAESAGGEGDAGRVLIKAVGVPKTGLLSLITIDSNQLSMVFDGTAGVADGGLSSIDGELVLRAGDVSKMLRVAGLEIPVGDGQLAYDGIADIAWSKKRFVMTPRDVEFAGARVGGRLSVTRASEGGPAEIDGDLVADSGSLPRLLSVVLSKVDRRAVARQVAQAQAVDGEAATGVDGSPAGGSVNDLKPVFSERTFELSSLKGISGSLKIKANKLEILEGFMVSGADTAVSVSGGKLSLQVTDGRALGGKFGASLSIGKAAAGAAVNGSLVLQQANIANIAAATGGASDFGKGRVSLKLGFAGRGLTPRGTMTVISGQGELKLEDVALRGLDPAGVRRAAEDALSVEEFTGEQLTELLLGASGGGKLELGTRNVKLAILDGAVRVSDVYAESPAGKTKVTTTVDLRNFGYDSDWQVVARDPKAGRPWPAVSVQYAGSIAKLAALEPRITEDALERELAVRKMERNVKELERLRRLDEEAAKRQRERERQLELESQRQEAERAAAAAAAAAGGGANGPSAGPASVGPVPGADGWQSQQTVTPPGEIGPSGSASEGLPASVEGEPLAPVATPKERVRPRRQRPRRKRKPKPKPLANQIFGD
ncbi:MAG: AsmA family protein [Alphaproteobacteria bacterium]|nr:AsmA family protein [Alphaproteobacteria bacterium]